MFIIATTNKSDTKKIYSVITEEYDMNFHIYLFFFLCVVSDSWPLSSSLSSDWLLLLLLEELLEDPLEESLATPVSSFTSIVSVNAASVGSLSLSTFNHFRDNFGLPRTCLWRLICDSLQVLFLFVMWMNLNILAYSIHLLILHYELLHLLYNYIYNDYLR